MAKRICFKCKRKFECNFDCSPLAHDAFMVNDCFCIECIKEKERLYEPSLVKCPIYRKARGLKPLREIFILS